MPAATPLPRTPSVLTLESAEDLLTSPGCPACRYVSEASDRYLRWFALEAHADPVTITRLCGSLGMCGRHTRLLMAQPGAAVRLTAVYGYLVASAREQLAGRAAQVAVCPACEHDEAAAGRALDTLLEGMTSEAIRRRCRELGGLCIPHLGAAARSGQYRAAGWLADTMAATVIARTSSLAWLAGTIDQDAEARAVLSRAIPLVAEPGSYACTACLAASVAERNYLARVMRVSDDELADPDLLLCPSHLADAALLAGDSPRLTPLLVWQANCHTASMTEAGRKAGKAAPWHLNRRRPSQAASCTVCYAQQAAASRALDDYRRYLRQFAPSGTALCVRHLLALRAADPWAGQVTAGDAIACAGQLIAELADAFDANTPRHRHELSGHQASAWRRAAAFIDGSVFCGSPPRRT
jgi:hypothetical protein